MARARGPGWMRFRHRLRVRRELPRRSAHELRVEAPPETLELTSGDRTRPMRLSPKRRRPRAPAATRAGAPTLPAPADAEEVIGVSRPRGALRASDYGARSAHRALAPPRGRRVRSGRGRDRLDQVADLSSSMWVAMSAWLMIPTHCWSSMTGSRRPWPSCRSTSASVARRDPAHGLAHSETAIGG